ncbi:MAG: hypothetical protein HOC24_09130 [Deltaproteobacteria bacterium]|jgi:uncharacterized protein|nr:hypothetical protein [Deltaproteobacteria bacterium]
MIWKSEWKPLVWILSGFLIAFYLPVGLSRFDNAIMESLHLVKWYAQEHVILCLVPAFFIAGAIAVFISQASVMKYLGPAANKVIAYGVSSVSGSVLAVCSCTVLPLFSGIYRMGAGIGPATAFLYSGPAINVLAIILTARVLGAPLGIARAVGAILFSIVIGLLMHFFFRKEEAAKKANMMASPEIEVKRPLWQNTIFFAMMIAILVFANWGKSDGEVGVWNQIYSMKWIITSVFALGLGLVLYLWFEIKLWKLLLVAVPVVILGMVFPEYPILSFAIGAVGLSILTSTDKGETEEWFGQTWDFAKQILPLLLFGVLIAGLLLGRPGNEGLIPSQWVNWAVGGNSVWANLFASVVGAFMYFATLTEIPILQGLVGNGMGQGPALALLLSGPALSLPNMLVIRTVLGTKKTIVFILLVIVMSTISGMIFGHFY